MASNIGGTATLIGDPPNIIIGSRADLCFNDFLIHLAPIVVVLMAVFVGVLAAVGPRLRRPRSCRRHDAAGGAGDDRDPSCSPGSASCCC